MAFVLLRDFDNNIQGINTAHVIRITAYGTGSTLQMSPLDADQRIVVSCKWPVDRVTEALWNAESTKNAIKVSIIG